MTVPEERERWSPAPPSALPEPRQPAEDRAAWFTYSAAGDQIVWSAALSAMLGRPPAEKEMTRQILARYVHRDDHAKALGAITEAWTSRNTVHTTVRLMRTDGGWFDVDCRLEPMMSPDGTVRGLRGTVQDVTHRERTRRENARLTRRGETVQASLIEPDPATGLLTRARFADEIDRALRGSAGAVLVVRVQAEDDGEDGVRPERNGELLRRAARLLEDRIPPEHLLGRVGPNEIGVLLAAAAWNTAHEHARRLIDALRSAPPADRCPRATAWGGLVRFEQDAEAGSHDLLIDAEQAWRQSRELRRPLTLVAHPVPVRDRQGSYRSRVADALGTDRFTLYSQPILELQTNKVTRHELLLRVIDEADGPQSPIQVLDTAERLDAIFDIDLWVVERAMRLAAEEPGLCLQVNLSGRSVGDPRLTAEVEKLLDRYAVDPAQLTFEITETALIGNLSEARRFADRVRDLGCGLALDDFGSGYASFRYLRLFPIDLVKIDGEYVVDLVDNPQDQVLVRALVQVCQAYGIHTVAEFVQDEPTLRMLRELGVDYVQGYLIGRPSPVPPGRLHNA
ncbi:putative diguanylate cyclase/phosphodiesterase with PAS sensor [Actinoplanes missouriensis 431]|uniref:Putative diguanylate cyclase/phosphodiesterase with PAS sensor n=1 Tax=Actinoplanes missouriensis (strain ATCC 14538 / DSM 43046 / CBS 188.64 / JCM 3121 / NBRC 102363 / NCIMB 12654 / NRRL B-3342 / UNCC 431) TaxID=512565 RepID=I0GZF9_ACTM4|nr:EAL domain-containing protein [Actinoplanes missouriensis]BAL86146.1 putative diguanylate cyclase/phosphodiesterase with PAS sensor [Actinoplanes missouriensis 431]